MSIYIQVMVKILVNLLGGKEVFKFYHNVVDKLSSPCVNSEYETEMINFCPKPKRLSSHNIPLRHGCEQIFCKLKEEIMPIYLLDPNGFVQYQSSK